MLKLSFLAITLALSIPTGFSATPSNHDIESNFADWDCWGLKSVNMTNRDNPDKKKVSMTLSTDICDRKDLRPLYVDVYLHNIKFKGASYNGMTVDILADAIHNITDNKQEVRVYETVNKTSKYVKRLDFAGVRSGNYSIKIKQIVVTFRNNGRTVGSFRINGNAAREGGAYIKPKRTNSALMSLIKEAKTETLRTGKPSQIVFGGDYEIPMTAGGGAYTSDNRGNLLIIPKIYNNEKYIIPHLLGDTHKGAAARCEGNLNAKTSDGTLQKAELYKPDEAWNKLNKPLVAINANYFDVRPQLNGTTWNSNLCSVPLGIYYDNIPHGPTEGTHNEPNKFFAGPDYFINDDNKKIALDAMFWIMDQSSKMEIFYSKQVSDPAIQKHAEELTVSGYPFIAISGSGLPVRALTPLPTPDSGESETTRLGMGSDDNDSVIYIFQGGSYRNGLSRDDLHNLFYGMDVSQSMELDGGGSAAIALDSNSFTLKGDNRPNSSCNETGLWCSLITQPDGKHRPVPSWIGLSINK